MKRDVQSSSRRNVNATRRNVGSSQYYYHYYNRIVIVNLLIQLLDDDWLRLAQLVGWLVARAKRTLRLGKIR